MTNKDRYVASVVLDDIKEQEESAKVDAEKGGFDYISDQDNKDAKEEEKEEKRINDIATEVYAFKNSDAELGACFQAVKAINENKKMSVPNVDVSDKETLKAAQEMQTMMKEANSPRSFGERVGKALGTKKWKAKASTRLADKIKAKLQAKQKTGQATSASKKSEKQEIGIK